MRSLAAWTSERAELRQQQETKNLLQEHDLQQAHDELLAINEKLLDTLILYGSVRAQGNQKKVLSNWISEQGTFLRNTIEEQTEKVRSNLMRSLTDAVAPLLQEVIQKKAVTDFCNLLEKVALRSTLESSVIKVPTGLNDAMLSEIQRRGLTVQLETVEGREITYDSGETSFQTIMSDAVEELEGILTT
jgi:carbamoylphosphate synthase small subunit